MKKFLLVTLLALSVATTASAFTFNSNLKLGIRGPDVKNLQILLNLDPDTIIATTGPGSKGNETTTFGPATKRAVIKFQNKYAKDTLAPSGLTTGTGVVGALTRKKLSAMVPSVSNVPLVPAVPLVSNRPTVLFSKSLYAGLTNDPEVKKLQTMLAQDGSLYPERTISGTYDFYTTKAVQKFQDRYNLATPEQKLTANYGAVGPKTTDMLYKIFVERQNIAIAIATTTNTTPNTVAVTTTPDITPIGTTYPSTPPPTVTPPPAPIPTTTPAPTPPVVPIVEPTSTPVVSTIPVPSAPISGTCVADASTEYLAANYYVNVATGSDVNNGLATGTAWQTLGKALSSAPAGSTVHVASGDYGMLQETVPVGRMSYLTIRATPGASPRLSGINIAYAVKSAAFLRIVGFTIKNYSYDPLNNDLVNIAGATDVELLNNTISSDSTRGSGYAIASSIPGQPYYIDGIRIDNTERVTIKSNCVSGVSRGIQLSSSLDVSLLRNYISPQSGTGIQYLPYNANVLIEDNHIRGMSFTPYCNFIAMPAILANCDTSTIPYPLDPNAFVDPHQSIISIRSNDVTIRNNIMHGMGGSSGIMAYLPDLKGVPTSYSNITIEGNLMYDIGSTIALRFYNVGDNLVVRNNTVISQYASGACTTGAPMGVLNDAEYRYSTAFMVGSIASGKTGSGLSLNNNIFVGATFLNGALATDKNNIFWSYAPVANTFSPSSLSGTSMIVTSAYLGCGIYSPYFETGFFATTPNFMPNHGLLYDYKLAPTSQAVGFGDTTSQLLRKLGTLDVNGFFINSVGARQAGEHSAGPYEP